MSLTWGTSADFVPETVLAAFGLEGKVQRLEGGEGRSVRCEDAVLKPVDDVTEAAWTCEVLANLDSDGFRVPRPLLGSGGRWVVEGWVASEWFAGQSGPIGHWQELIDAGRRFHEALIDLARPQFLDGRTHRWAVADRVAWGESTVVPLPEHLEMFDRSLRLLRPVQSHSQVVHGDLSGNVLFAPGLPPAVIDFSPYWRPTAWADAVVAVDGMLWFNADESLYPLVRGDHADFGQMFIRAIVFRLVAHNESARRSGLSDQDELAAFERVISWCEQNLA